MEARKFEQLSKLDKIMLLRSSSWGLLEQLRAGLSSVCMCTIERRGALDDEEFCCRLVDWLRGLCDVSEGFAITLADLLTEERPESSVPVGALAWLG